MRPPLALLAIAGAVVFGCADDNAGDPAAKRGTVDSSTVEQQIESQLSGPTTTITSVDCPSDVPKKKGDTFNCKAKIEGGGSATVVVTQVNGVNRYSYAFKPGTLKIPGSSVEPAVEKSLEAEGLDVTSVSCPDTIVVKPDSPVTCTAATASGAEINVTFTISSDGEVDPSSVEAD